MFTKIWSPSDSLVVFGGPLNGVVPGSQQKVSIWPKKIAEAKTRIGVSFDIFSFRKDQPRLNFESGRNLLFYDKRMWQQRQRRRRRWQRRRRRQRRRWRRRHQQQRREWCRRWLTQLIQDRSNRQKNTQIQRHDKYTQTHFAKLKMLLFLENQTAKQLKTV